MSDDFIKEDRYLVIKRSDIKSALDGEMKSVLQHIAQTVEGERHSLGKPVLECVVVEHDWSIYDDVWKMVEAIATNQQTELEQLRKERDELKLHLDELISHFHEEITKGGNVIRCEDGSGLFFSLGAINGYTSRIKRVIRDDDVRRNWIAKLNLKED